MTYKVLVTCKQMQESLDELLAETPMPDFSFTTPELTKQGFTSREMAELMKGHDAAIVGDDVVDEAVLSVPGLQFVCKWGAGVDGIDFEAAKRNGIQVTNTPGMFGQDVADLAFAYLVSIARSTLSIHESVLQGSWPRIRGKSLRDMSVVVYGVGDIGRNLCKRLLVSEARVIGFDPLGENEQLNQELNISWAKSLNEACNVADALIISCPLNDKTAGSVNKEILSLMKQRSIVVNVSRGGILSEKDLALALSSGQLMGAALDVFHDEPLPGHSILRKTNGIILGSHNASNAEASVLSASRSALAKISQASFATKK